MNYELINPIDESLTALEQVFFNRGISKEEVPRYLEIADGAKEFNHDPTLLKNIDVGIKMLMKHLLDPKGKIFVQVD